MKYTKLYYWANILNTEEVYLGICMGFIASFFVTIYIIPKLILLSKRKRILALPNNRSSHSQAVPHFGGVGIFYALSIVGSVFATGLMERYKLFFASLLILFFVGLLDDLIDIKARNKLIAQIIAGLLLMIGSGVYISNLQGTLGIEAMNLFWALLFTLLFIIFIINSFNLIDGVDGLAGGLATIITTSFAFIFFRFMDFEMSIFCSVLIGALIGFLRYNLSNKRKIFMGDTGSLVVGFCLAFFAIRFLELTTLEHISFRASPSFVFAMFVVPIVDTLHVIVVRMRNKTSIFIADKNHLHHLLLRRGFSHRQTALILCLFTISALALVYTLRGVNNNYLIIALLTISVFTLLILKRSIKSMHS